MKILIVDDHKAVRIGLKHILAGEFPSAKFDEANTSADVPRLGAKDGWDLIILDISLPGRSGLDVLRELKYAGVKVPVLVFSFHQEDQFAFRALKAGAHGFLSKDASDTEIIKAVRQILGGRKYITQRVAEIMADQLEGDDLRPHELLSDREYETLLHIASGKTITQIAKLLSLGVPTVSTYRTRILEKMKMSTNAELTRYVIENNLSA